MFSPCTDAGRVRVALGMMRSGVALLDEGLGGLLPGRPYVLIGGPGTGKTSVCLQFLATGVSEGSPAAMLTHDDPSDLLAQGQFLGLDLRKPLADGRLVMLRYRPDFARRYAWAPSHDVVFNEIRRLIGPVVPARLAIDSIAPFLDGSAATGSSIASMVQFLDALGTTAMMTYAGAPSSLTDVRLQPLLQRAGAIFHLRPDGDRTHYLEVLKARYTLPESGRTRFRIQPGAGVVPVRKALPSGTEAGHDHRPRRILALNPTGKFPEEMISALRADYEVTPSDTTAAGLLDLDLSATDAVLIDVDLNILDDTIKQVIDVRRAGKRIPIVVVSRFSLRSTDRARCLGAGADEFLHGDLGPRELLLRLGAALRRSPVSVSPATETDAVPQAPAYGDGQAMLDADAFRLAIGTRVAREWPVFFTIVILTPEDGQLNALGDVVVRAIRAKGGDFACLMAGHVVACLNEARRRDIAPFVDRVRDVWRRNGHGKLRLRSLAYPVDEADVRALIDGGGIE